MCWQKRVALTCWQKCVGRLNTCEVLSSTVLSKVFFDKFLEILMSGLQKLGIFLTTMIATPQLITMFSYEEN